MAGVDVVLLHGWMVGAELWAHQEEALTQVARPHEIVQPGHGVAVSRLRQNATMPDWAAWLSRELDGRGITDAVFVGHGMGGFVVEELWRRDRRRIKALVLVSTLDEAVAKTNERRSGCSATRSWTGVPRRRRRC